MAKRIAEDMLAQKQRESNAFTQQSNLSVSMVTETISQLSAINSDIDQNIREINDYISLLTEVRAELFETKNKNETIVKNFEKLLTA